MADQHTELTMGTLLLAEAVSAPELLRHVRASLPDAQLVTSQEGEDGAALVQWQAGEVTVFFTPIPGSHPDEVIVEHIHPGLTEEDDIPAIVNHTAQILLVASRFGTEGDQRARLSDMHRVHGQALRSIVNLDSAVGYSLPGTTMGMGELRRELHNLPAAPVMVWAPVWLWAGDDGITAYTYGLSNFGHPELQVVDSKAELAAVFTLLLDTAAYIIDEGATLNDGDSYQLSTGEAFAVTAEPWLVDASIPAVTLSV